MWKVSTILYNSVAVQKDIKDIWIGISEIYSDISTALIDSALQAITAAEHSDNCKNEIHSAISHLMDAYNISKNALSKTKKKRKFLFFTSTVNLIPFSKRNNYYAYLAHLAGIISILYKSLNQRDNHSVYEWKNKAMENFKSSIDIPARDLWHIDHRFAEVIKETREVVIGVVDGPDIIAEESYKVYYRTIEGEKYIQDQVEEFGVSIDQRKLDLESLTHPFSI